MKLISNTATGLLCAVALSAFGAEQVRELPLNFSTVDVTQNIKRRFGAPHVAVNPKNPNDPNDAFRIVGDQGPSSMAIDGYGGVHVVWAD